MELKLSQNKVLSGHSRKLRDGNDLTKNLAADMDVIFGVRADVYSSDHPPPPPSHVNPKRRTTSPGRGHGRGAISERKKSRRDNNRENKNGLSSGATNKKNKRKIAYNYLGGGGYLP